MLVIKIRVITDIDTRVFCKVDTIRICFSLIACVCKKSFLDELHNKVTLNVSTNQNAPFHQTFA